jgi:hypothetical protein
MIDRLREQIQHRLDQALGEAERLRKALAALDPRSPSAPARKAPARRGQGGRPTGTASAGRRGAAASGAAKSAKPGPKPAARRAPSAARARKAGAAATPETATSARRRRATTAQEAPPAAAKAPRRQAQPAAPEQTAEAKPTGKPAARAGRRTASGDTRALVLAALGGGEPLTAGQLAEKAGLPRSTVSATLSRLARSGEVEKADRGYRLATGGPSPAESGGERQAPAAAQSAGAAQPPAGAASEAAGGSPEAPSGEAPQAHAPIATAE